jgi:hypothetical protein
MSSSKDPKFTRTDVGETETGPSRPDNSSVREWTGVTRGVLVQLDQGGPLVDFEGNPERKPLLASSTIALREPDLGREAVLMFEDGDPRRPILVGLIQTVAAKEAVVVAEVDGDSLELSAERQIVLRCGEASITLTRAGKVLIRGKYILSRSSGVNMVKGGIIHLN